GAAVSLPMVRRPTVSPACHFRGQRFDEKTRLPGAPLFLVQRGPSAGVTIYAPAIIISTVLGWRLDLVVVFTGLLVLAYTVTGGSLAGTLAHRRLRAGTRARTVSARRGLLPPPPARLGPRRAPSPAARTAQ